MRAKQLQNYISVFRAAAAVLTERKLAARSIVRWMDRRRSPRKFWNDLLTFGLIQLAVEAATAMRLQRAHGPELPRIGRSKIVAATLDEIIHQFESGHSVG